MNRGSGIYKITNIISGKTYIGSAINLSQRKSVHLYDLKNNWHSCIKLQRAFNKYGIDAFKFDVIEYILDKETLIQKEQYYLNLFLFADKKDKRFNELGYNICRIAGSNIGYKHTEEWKLKASIRNRGKKVFLSDEAKDKISSIGKANKGRKISDETKLKMSASRKLYLEKYGHPMKGKSIKGHSITDAQKEALRIFRTGKKHTEETRIKMSISQQKRNNKNK